MRITTLFVALATTLSSLPAGGASAASPPRVEAYYCAPLAAEIGPENVWNTWFRGAKRDLWDRVWRTQESPCFDSQAKCKAWLYWAQTDWPFQNTFRPCRRGNNY